MVRAGKEAPLSTWSLGGRGLQRWRLFWVEMIIPVLELNLGQGLLRGQQGRVYVTFALLYSGLLWPTEQIREIKKKLVLCCLWLPLSCSSSQGQPKHSYAAFLFLPVLLGMPSIPLALCHALLLRVAENHYCSSSAEFPED